jgi:hypothetical protein
MVVDLGMLAFNQDFRFPSFPRRRESSHSLKSVDTRLRGYDEFTGLAKVLLAFLDLTKIAGKRTGTLPEAASGRR